MSNRIHILGSDKKLFDPRCSKISYARSDSFEIVFFNVYRNLFITLIILSSATEVQRLIN